MLDPRGKTLSHAYIEVHFVDARDALRSVQNKSLGKGRRLRGVTVTMSSQNELMRGVRVPKLSFLFFLPDYMH